MDAVIIFKYTGEEKITTSDIHKILFILCMSSILSNRQIPFEKQFLHPLHVSNFELFNSILLITKVYLYNFFSSKDVNSLAIPIVLPFDGNCHLLSLSLFFSYSLYSNNKNLSNIFISQLLFIFISGIKIENNPVNIENCVFSYNIDLYCIPYK